MRTGSNASFCFLAPYRPASDFSNWEPMESVLLENRYCHACFYSPVSISSLDFLWAPCYSGVSPPSRVRFHWTSVLRTHSCPRWCHVVTPPSQVFPGDKNHVRAAMMATSVTQFSLIQSCSGRPCTKHVLGGETPCTRAAFGHPNDHTQTGTDPSTVRRKENDASLQGAP